MNLKFNYEEPEAEQITLVSLATAEGESKGGFGDDTDGGCTGAGGLTKIEDGEL